MVMAETKKDMRDVFSKQLIKSLKRSGLTQRKLADKIGATESAVSRYLTGSRVPNLYFLVKLSEALDTTPNELLNF